MMILRISIASLLSFILGAALFAGARHTAGPVAKAVTVETQEDRAADAAAIRAHIESIFQAFIDGDIDKIHATHSDDWRGFLEGTRVPIKGIDEYMMANGIEWPRPAARQKRFLISRPARAIGSVTSTYIFIAPSWQWPPFSATSKETSAASPSRCGDSA